MPAPTREHRRSFAVLADFGALGPLALFLLAAPAAGAAVLVATGDRWLGPLADLGVGTVPVYLAATILLSGLSLIPTHASSLVGGLLFGAVAGSAWSLAGVAGAAFLGFVALRRVAGDRALRALARRPRAAAVHRALLARRGRTLLLVVLLRLSPAMPFAGTNLLMAAGGVGLVEFLVGSVVGLAPRVIAVSVAGAGLAELDLSQAADVRLAVLGLLATVAVLVLVSRLGRRALREVDAATVGE